MKYLRTLTAVASQPWALQPEKLQAIVEFLLFQAHGGKFDAGEIEARITQQRERETARAGGAIGILPVYGVLSQRVSMMSEISGGTSVDALSAQFAAMLEDDRIKAIVMDVDSPGGNVHGIEEFAARVFEARGSKPIVAQVNSLMASAAYWIGAQADEIVMTPSGEAGSIGVYTVHDDISGALEAGGVKRTLISDGKHKAEGASFQPLSQDARENLEMRVREYGDTFRADVARGRKTTVKNVSETFGDGRVFGAREAQKRGMVDRIGTLSETLARFDGSQAPRRTGMMAVRAAFGAGGLPTLPNFEAFLCEAGASKTQARAIAGRGLSYLARCEAEEQASTSSAALRALLATPFGKLTPGEAR